MRAEAKTVLRSSLTTGLVCSLLIAFSYSPVGALFPSLTVVLALYLMQRYPLEELGRLELPGVLDAVALYGGMLFLLLGGVASAVLNDFQSFFLVLVVFMSAGAMLVSWKGGAALFVFSGVLGSIFSLQLGFLTASLLGLPWFLSVFATSSIWRYQDEFDPSISVDDFWDCVALILVFGFILGVPLWAWGTIAPSIQPEWTESTVGHSAPEQGQEPSSLMGVGLKLFIFVLVTGFLLIGVYWLIQKLRADEGEPEAQVEMPDEESMGVDKTTSDDRTNLQQVVRGGRKAEVLKAVHRLLNQFQNTERERHEHETITDYLRRGFTPDVLSMSECKFVTGVYAGARYGYREPSEDELNRFLKLVNSIEVDERP